MITDWTPHPIRDSSVRACEAKDCGTSSPEGWRTRLVVKEFDDRECIAYIAVDGVELFYSDEHENLDVAKKSAEDAAVSLNLILLSGFKITAPKVLK